MPETPDLYGELVYLDSALFQSIVANGSVDKKVAQWRNGEGKFLDGTNALDLACDRLRKCGSDQAAQDYCLRQILGSTARFSFWGMEVVEEVRIELINGITSRFRSKTSEAGLQLMLLVGRIAQATQRITEGTE